MTLFFIFRFGIKVIGFSADGDARLLSSMLHYTKLNAFDFTNDAASTETFEEPTLCCLQDTVHIGTKLRNRLLIASIVLVLGQLLISVTHLKILINDVPKEVHGLTINDICPDDRQNYGSLEKIMQSRVLDALAEHVVGSEGTILYLELCAKVTSSLCDDDLDPLERIYRLEFAKFVFRAWRKWILKEGASAACKYKVPENCITDNAYKCIEVNAANLVKLTRMFRDCKMDELYLPSLFNSQPNEEIFRQFRSMGTINYTKINFSLLELFHLVGRVELQNQIVYVHLEGAGVSFPRNKINKAKINNHPLPSDTDISNIINKAKNDAVEELSNLGISIEAAEISECEYVYIDKLQGTTQNNGTVTDSDDDDFEQEHPNPDSDSVMKPSANIDIILENGTKKTIRKSTYLWSLTDSRSHLSNDRLKRVQQATTKTETNAKRKMKPRRLVFKKEISPTETQPILTLNKNEDLIIGNWCIFQIERNPKQKNSEKLFVLGNVMAFRYIKGATAKKKQYSWESAPISPPIGVKKRGIEVLASWFEIGSSTNLSPMDKLNCFYIDIEKYVFTLDCPAIQVDRKSLSFTNDMHVLEKVNQQLNKSTKPK